MFEIFQLAINNLISCRLLHIFHELLLIVVQVIVCCKNDSINLQSLTDPVRTSVLLTVRIYALYECNKRILTVLVFAGSLLTALSIVSAPCHNLLKLTFIRSPHSSCHSLTSRTSQKRPLWGAIQNYPSLR